MVTWHLQYGIDPYKLAELDTYANIKILVTTRLRETRH